MSLIGSSDDSIALILQFLTGEDVLRLLAIGSKALTSRILQNSTNLDFAFNRSTLFPFSAYRFPKLRSLAICNGYKGGSRHLSTKGRSLLPLEPVTSLEALKLEFASSSALFDSGSLNVAFPNLTSLTVLCDGPNVPIIAPCWAESLPKTILSLKIRLPPVKQSWNSARLNPITFDSLPEGLQHIYVRAQPISPGTLNLKRFKNLKTVDLRTLTGYQVLDHLPDSLEEASLFFDIKGSLSTTGEGVFLTSNLPPKIRVWDVYGTDLSFEFNSIVPTTLETSYTNWKIEDITPETLQKYFPNHQNLRTLSVKLRLAGSLPKSMLELLPNLEVGVELSLLADDANGLSFLPKKLKTLLVAVADFRSLSWPQISYKELPQNLEFFHGVISGASQLIDLPKTLKVANFASPWSFPLPPSVWCRLPPRLNTLSVDMTLFESFECLKVLPETMETLILRANKKEHISTLEIPETLQKSLISLSVRFNEVMNRSMHSLSPTPTEWMQNLEFCSKLTSLSFSSEFTPLSHSTLDILPPSLTSLVLDGITLENYGLPPSESPVEDEKVRSESDWSKAAFSRLPESLEVLRLSFRDFKDLLIDFNVFSNLPRRLSELYIRTPKKNLSKPKKIHFVSTKAHSVDRVPF